MWTSSNWLRPLLNIYKFNRAIALSRYRADAEPAVLFPWSGETSELLAATSRGGNHLIREDCESAEAFMARAETTSER